MSTHKEMRPEEAVNLLSWKALKQGSSLCAARRSAIKVLRRLAVDGCRCFRVLAELHVPQHEMGCAKAEKE